MRPASHMPLAEMMTHGLRAAVQRDALVDLLDVADVPLAEQVGVRVQQLSASRRRSTPGAGGRPRWRGPPSGYRRRSAGPAAGRRVKLVQEVDDRLRAADG